MGSGHTGPYNHECKAFCLIPDVLKIDSECLSFALFPKNLKAFTDNHRIMIIQ